ncbi:MULTISPECIES: hypothetical protein [Methylomonas]|uniref:Uncharacterized protein n=2 Tax=Methylomonas TaxID=416 RepID=A0A140E4K7_9GAMM|nr:MULTISPECIES: hypothetical protein [Methylomonas]AMK75331.1 hypothetical protein JT25_002310 [Methylomonas denitrificans]OAH99278.1 hypothetical protein A1342_03905 [Methylomonas methanica]TCV84922.1 hypothetical protein EDE11_10633 [Methylomonas methanica]
MNVVIIGLLAVAAVSGIGGWLLSSKQSQETPVKIMMFVGYFWLLAFAQFLLVALGYFGWQHFSG